MLGTLWLATTLYNFNQTPYLQANIKHITYHHQPGPSSEDNLSIMLIMPATGLRYRPRRVGGGWWWHEASTEDAAKKYGFRKGHLNGKAFYWELTEIAKPLKLPGLTD